ncbi:M60 family metallopeptidase [Nonomuraea candida]|uniref:M60 family metallopeptidase n=1 Tax=Nonomuraea candida TaxID=359159 RepID=UPI00069362E7|nr:M60 family metallopeptidase [Nonomuraea candida]
MPLTRRTLITGLTAAGAASLLSRPASAAPVPAPRTVVLRGRPAAEAERLRMQTVYRTTEFVPTGLYLPPGRALTLEVRANDGVLPVAHVGAADTNPDTAYRYPRGYALAEGVNTISDPGGGPVYLSMAGDRRARAVVRFGPEGVPTPTFVLAPSSGCGDPALATSRAWQGRAGFAAPVFAARGTTEAEFQAQVDTLTDAPFVELVSPQMIVTVRRETFLQVRDQDHAELMRLLEQVEDVEAAVSGLDGSSAPHAPTPLGRHLINVRPEYGPKSTAYATHAYTAYYDAYTTTRLLLPDKVRTTGWGVYHELGHQHQQMAWRPSELTEVTVNIYSLAVQRHFGMPSNLVTNKAYETALAKLPVTSYAGLGAFEKLVPFRQLELGFGDGFYPRVHRLVREERPASSSGDSARRFTLMALYFSRAAGHDLTTFLRAWAFPVPESGYAELAALGLPAPGIDLTALVER